MARLAQADGIRAIVATPHADQWGVESNLEAAWRAINRLGSALAKEGLDLRIVPGLEVPISERLGHDLDTGRAFPLAESRYILLNLPTGRLSAGLDATWETLDRRGLRPIVAGAEQHRQIQRDSRPIERWVERGGLVMIAAASLTGGQGDLARRTAEDFLRRRLAHLIASDGHAATGDRTPRLSAAVAAASAIVGEAAARDLVTLTPLTILANGDVPIEPPVPAQRPWWRVW